MLRRPGAMGFGASRSATSRRVLWLAAVGCRQCECYSTATNFDITSVRASKDSSPSDKTSNLPLSGVRVLELGQLIAGPFTGQLLGCVVAFPPVFVQVLAPVLKCDSMGQFGGSVGISVPRLSKSNRHVVEIRFACGASWMSTGRALGFVAWRVTRRVSRSICARRKAACAYQFFLLNIYY
jgi:hypothetical protein